MKNRNGPCRHVPVLTFLPVCNRTTTDDRQMAPVQADGGLPDDQPPYLLVGHRIPLT